jgi:DUF2971 family protein
MARSNMREVTETKGHTVSDRYLRRYSDLTALFYLLSNRALTLLDPKSWEDSNDSYYLALYKKKKKLKSVLALCFTESDERFHYWRVFGAGASGVCLQFDRRKLLKAVTKQSGLEMGRVEYVKLAAIRKRKLLTKELPFLKRFAFEHECEFRIIYASKKDDSQALDIPIPLFSIDKITVSPWINRKLFACVKERLRSIDGCGSLEIVRSSLIGNEEWKALGEKAK